MEELIKNLEKRNINAIFVKTKEEALNEVIKLVKENDVVSWGGSVTLEETGIKDYLRKKEDIKLLEPGTAKTPEEKKKILIECFDCDVYLSSANAILTDGRIINIDGLGNRVAATIFGPKKIIYVIGKNKIVNGILDDGINRVKDFASPLNTKRLNKNTPCRITGKCADCRSQDRICRSIGIIEFQKYKNEMYVILVDEDLGY